LLSLATAGDDALHSAIHSVLYGAEFGDHAAGAEGGFFLLGMMDHGVHILDDGDGAFFGVLHVTQQTGGAGEQDEGVGFPKAGDAGGELVVVAEAQLLDGDAVVFIDDGDDLGELQQALQCGFDPQGTLFLGQIFVRDEELGHVQAVVAQQIFIRVHEVGLTHGGQRLERGHVAGAGGHLQRLKPGGHGTAADHHDAMPGLLHQGDGLDELAQLHRIRLGRVELGQNAGTEFEDDALWGCVRHGWKGRP
jgi:hypothetical protein